MMKRFVFLLTLVSFLFATSVARAQSDLETEAELEELKDKYRPENDRIQPYAENPYYWQYHGEPVMLLGASDNDNLFQWTGSRLIAHLDLLRSVGGNYARNVMSSRDEGDVYAFKRLSNGQYDLNQWNPEYWKQLDNFLAQTRERGVIVQLTLWDAFDWQGEKWETSPWNPRNNVNYTAEQSGLPAEWPHHPARQINPFALTVPGLPNAERGEATVLPLQERFNNKVLQVALAYDHVLYTIHNEDQAPQPWADYWARFVHAQAAAKDKNLEVADMRNERYLDHQEHLHQIRHPQLYTYFEASQNSWIAGQLHYDRVRLIRSMLEDNHPRPVNNVKMYRESKAFGGEDDGLSTAGPDEPADKLWRNIFAGAAAARFHRPPGGLGLSKKVQIHLRSARLLVDAMNIFSAAPHDDLLSARKANEAYALAEPGEQYAVFFTGVGDRSVKIDLSAAQDEMTARWLDVDRSAWARTQKLRSGGHRTLSAPGSGQWAVLVKPAKSR